MIKTVNPIYIKKYRENTKLGFLAGFNIAGSHDPSCCVRNISLSSMARRLSSWVRTRPSRSSCRLCASTALSSLSTRARSARSAVHVSAALAHTDDNDLDTYSNAYTCFGLLYKNNGTEFLITEFDY